MMKKLLIILILFIIAGCGPSYETQLASVYSQNQSIIEQQEEALQANQRKQLEIYYTLSDEQLDKVAAFKTSIDSRGLEIKTVQADREMTAVMPIETLNQLYRLWLEESEIKESISNAYGRNEIVVDVLKSSPLLYPPPVYAPSDYYLYDDSFRQSQRLNNQLSQMDSTLEEIEHNTRPKLYDNLK